LGIAILVLPLVAKGRAAERGSETILVDPHERTEQAVFNWSMEHPGGE
jgi:hypothetical protein